MTWTPSSTNWWSSPEYAVKVRKDHALFVDAFRSGSFDLVSA